jgi:TRAP-type C4-dicarboxylate transport system permease small subunit
MIKRILAKFVKYYRLFETGSLVFFLSAIFLLAVLQIFLKKVPGTEFINSIIKYSVLWAAMISACIATYEGKHIKIDIIGRFAKGRLKQIVLAITGIFAAVSCLVLFFAFVLYIIRIEIPSSDPAPFFNIPRWILILILPYSFLLISIRFSIQSVKSLINFITNNIPEEHEELPIGMDKETK